MKCSVSMVQYWIKKYGGHKNLRDADKPGHPQAMTGTDDEAIVAVAKRDAVATSTNISRI